MYKNKIFATVTALILTFMLLFCITYVAFAVEDEGTTMTKSSQQNETDTKNNDNKDKKEKEIADKKSDDGNSDKDEKKEEQKRKVSDKPVIPQEETAILIDAFSGNVLFEKDSTKRMYPASTTKVMTALLAIEAIERGEASMDSQIEITSEMIDGLDPDGSNIALKVGEVMSLENLLKGMLIPSGNDAACSIATYIGKSQSAFVDMMNARAKELGCQNTNFANPDGLHDDNHYTTAADMAKISYAAMKKYEFRNIVDCAHIKIPPTNMSPERYYINTNGLLSTMRYLDYFYKGATGIKTGSTQAAGNCLISSAKRNGMEFIAVLFGGKGVGNSHKDSIQMFDWAFEVHEAITPISKGDMLCEIKVKQGRGSDSIALSTASNVTVIVPKGTKPDALELRPNTPKHIVAPINADDNIGTLSVLLNGKELATCELLASTSIKRSFFWPVLAVGDFLWGNAITRTIIYVLGLGVIMFVILFIIGVCKNIRKATIHKRKRQSRRH